MKSLMRTKLRLVSSLILIAGVISLALTYYSRAKAPKTPKATQGFTLYSTMFTTPKDGQPVKTGSRVRYQRSDGQFKQETTYYNADGHVQKVDVLFGQPNRGVFATDENSRTTEFVSTLHPSSIIRSEEDLHQSHRNIIREDRILGYRVIVARPDDDGNGSYTELYHAPDLMGFHIKTAVVNESYKLVIEPTRIVPGDPPEAALRDDRNYPVSYDLFERKVEALEERGDAQTANEMKRILDAVKNRKP